MNENYVKFHAQPHSVITVTFSRVQSGLVTKNELVAIGLHCSISKVSFPSSRYGFPQEPTLIKLNKILKI